VTRHYIWQLNQVFPFLLVFARISATFTFIPGFGERIIPMQMRFIFSFIISLLLFPLLIPYLPEKAENAWFFMCLCMAEIFIGLFMGMCGRLLFSTLDIVGTFIGFKIGLMNAFSVNPISGTSGSLAGLLMSLTATTLLFVADIHHSIIKTLLNSYEIYQPVQLPVLLTLSQETLEVIVYITVLSFTLALQMSTPFIILGLLYFISLGILNRLMPQLPVFFIGQPLQLFLGFILIMFIFSPVMTIFMNHVRELFIHFWEPKQINLIK